MNIQLVNYIKENLSKGYSKEELKQILKESSWSELEIDEAFEYINPKEKKSQSKPTVLPSSLIDFITKALTKGFSKDKITQALLSKGWKADQIKKAISKAEESVPKQQPQIAKPSMVREEPRKEEKPEKFKKPIKFNYKKILMHVLFFFVVGIVFSGTVFLSFYISELGSDLQCPSSEPNCSLKGVALDNTFDNSLLLSILAGSVFSLLFVILYAIMRQEKKNTIIWIANTLYLLLIIYVIYQWIAFNF